MRTLPLRTTLFVAAVVAMVLLYLFWWTTYVGIHFDERYVQRPAGAVGEVGGTTIRLLSLTRSAMLADQKYSDVPEQASPEPPGSSLSSRRCSVKALILLLHLQAAEPRRP